MSLPCRSHLIKELGHIYAVALAERGHNVKESSDLVNGLVAYHYLDLKGEFEDLDREVESVVKSVYDGVLARIGKKGD